ncbi:auxin efflux carrier [Myxozyma melibiosi]|uniref:Auxin efflux carrier n=1 Tax=Myxozyma melibiosi TaxID=54550 RepID=A0ABR1F2D8_9ASCO
MSGMTVGASIFVAVKPIVKICLSVFPGVYFSKKNVLDIHTSKKVSSMLINYFLPCIVFNKVVNAFDSGTMRTVGVCVLASVLYIAAGIVYSFVLRLFTPVPKYWRGGSAVASIFNNAGDIPMAYVMTITANSPFKDGDETKGIAYVSVMMSVYVAALFACGSVQLIEDDFDYPLSEIDLELAQKSTSTTAPKSSKSQRLRNMLRRKTSSSDAEEKENEKSECETQPEMPTGRANPILARTSALQAADSNELRPTDSPGVRSIRQRLRRTQEEYEPQDDEDDDGDALDPVVSAVTAEIVHHEAHNVVLARLIIFLRNLYQPPTASLIVSIVVAVINPIKALFVQTDYNMRQAPDGQPPLDFVMDFTEFIGNACVPFGLLLLGGMIGRLSIKSLPRGFWKYLVSIVLLKLVVTPIIAIAFTQGLRKANVIDSDNLVLAFVFIMSSGVPSSTSQVYLTSFFAPEDMEHIPQMDCLAACLIAQYVALVFTLAILVTYTLQIII